MSIAVHLHEVYACIQGEGRWTGTPMVLVRFQGCRVGCPWCDTVQSWKEGHETGRLPARTNMVVEHVANLAGAGIRWVLLTGGEPFEQPDALIDLAIALRARGFKVAVETSGTDPLPAGRADVFDWLCVSPKVGMPGRKNIHFDTIDAAHEIKQVVGRIEDIDRLAALLDAARLRPDVVVSVQPVSGSKSATALCVRVCKERGWTLSLQTHKLIGEP